MQDRGKPRDAQLSGTDGDKTQEELRFIEEQKAALAREEGIDEAAADCPPVRSPMLKAAEQPVVKPLAKTHGHRGERRPVVLPAESPPGEDVHFPTGRAARYCGYRTPNGLRKAWYSMLVFPIGRRGGRKGLVWRKSELDRFLRGEPLLKSQAAGLLMPPTRPDDGDSDNEDELIDEGRTHHDQTPGNEP